jgi:hypothetical protein
MSGRVRGSGWHAALPALLAVTALLLAGCGEDDAGDLAGSGDSATVTSTPPSTPEPSDSSPSAGSTKQPPPTARPPATPPPAGDTLTMADNGKVVRMSVGESVSLQLTSPWTWETPTVRGDAVQVYPLNNIVDSGHQEWIISAVGPGEAVVRSLGDAHCPPGAQCILGDKIVEITIQVTR